MLKRKIDSVLDDFYNTKEKKALLITGARQVGKTYCIDEFARKYYRTYIRVNFIETPEAVSIFDKAQNADELLFRISAVAHKEIVPGETLIFFDEVQRCPDIVTAIKFLVDKGGCQYILSGSLLGVELKNIRSVPVGYMDEIEMYPLDFEEFCWANGVSDKIIHALKDCFENRQAVDEVVHSQMMKLVRLYLIVGGMPAVVQKFVDRNNLQPVVEEQRAIIKEYRRDISQYDPEDKLYIEDIFDMIPTELNSKNKRFVMKNLNEKARFSIYKNGFIWLKDAGVALPVYCADEPAVPLKLSESTNLFKLFMNDVGLLASMYMNDIQLKILNEEVDINFGAIYENLAAQELKAHGFDLYYFNSRKQGELDFMIEENGHVVPIEIKSGKNYKRHAALTNVMNNPAYDIQRGIVFTNDNLSADDRITYCPIYMLMFLHRVNKIPDMPVSLDISALK